MVSFPNYNLNTLNDFLQEVVSIILKDKRINKNNFAKFSFQHK